MPWMWAHDLPDDYPQGRMPAYVVEAFTHSTGPPPFDVDPHTPIILRGSRDRREAYQQPGSLACRLGDRAVRMLRITAFDLGEFDRATAPIALRIQARYPTQRSWPWRYQFHSDEGCASIYLRGKEYQHIAVERVGLLRQMLKLVEAIDEVERQAAPPIPFLIPTAGAGESRLG